MNPMDDVFVDLPPPPGGLRRLRSRLDRRRRWQAPALALAAAAVLLTLALPPQAPPPDLSPLLSTPSSPISVLPAAAGRLAVSEIETGTPELVHYRVAGVVSAPD